MQEFLRFSAIMSGICALAFVLHISYFEWAGMPLFANHIITSYVGNLFVALNILAFLMFAPKNLQNSLGFLFMLGSFFKFGFFFLFLYPNYTAEDGMQKHEFFAFFVPYSVCLIVETKLLINRLSRD